MTPEFFRLVGEVVIAWSSLERSVDLMLSKFGVFYSKEGDAIVAWGAKSKELRKLYEQQFQKPWVGVMFEELNKMAELRHTIVHGYCLGLNDLEPPSTKFVSAKFHAYATDQKVVEFTANELTGFRNSINKMQDQIGLILMSALTKSQ